MCDSTSRWCSRSRATRLTWQRYPRLLWCPLSPAGDGRCMTPFNPSMANMVAVVRLMPLSPPVTRAYLPLSLWTGMMKRIMASRKRLANFPLPVYISVCFSGTVTLYAIVGTPYLRGAGWVFKRYTCLTRQIKYINHMPIIDLGKSCNHTSQSKRKQLLPTNEPVPAQTPSLVPTLLGLPRLLDLKK